MQIRCECEALCDRNHLHLGFIICSKKVQMKCMTGFISTFWEIKAVNSGVFKNTLRQTSDPLRPSNASHNNLSMRMERQTVKTWCATNQSRKLWESRGGRFLGRCSHIMMFQLIEVHSRSNYSLRNTWRDTFGSPGSRLFGRQAHAVQMRPRRIDIGDPELTES